MNCPRCNSPASEETLREFGGVCPKCLLHFAEEKDAPAFPSLEIVEMIGQGGMGVVYKAIQKNLGRTVALKVLSPQLSSDPDFVDRFTREAKALAQLNHPNIVAIYDSGIHDRVPYLVMEYVKGQSLRQLLATKQLTAPQALELVPQICDALYYAHAKGVIHRDIKPENILIDGAGRVKIADYGLAKMASLDQPRITKSNVAMGTPHYMAPEQIERTSEVDHRADIYSLGVVIYEMLTGELPLGRFKAPSERAAIDRRLDRVVLKSLEKEPDDRYQSANEVKAQIAKLDQAPPPAAAGPRLSRIAVTSGILCLLGVAVLTVAIIMVLDHVIGANVFAALGGALLLASIGFSVPAVILILSSRGALRGLWIPVTSGFFSGLVLLVGLIATPSLKQSPPTPTRSVRELREVRNLWSEQLPDAAPVLGILSTEASLHLVTGSEIRDYSPKTGQYLARWSGTLEDLPLVSGNRLALWSDGKIVLLEDAGSGLTETARLDIPFRDPVAGATISGGIFYLQTVRGDVVAVGLATGKLLWKDPAPPGLKVPPGNPPIITDLDVITIHDVGMELRHVATGAKKSHSNQVLPEGKMLQWEQGWGVLHQSGINIAFNTYFKSMVRDWWAMNTTTTPVLADCHMALIKNLVILTTVNQIFSVGRNAPFGNDWGGSTIPHTVGPLTTFGEEFVAVPTVEGVLFFRAEDGRRMQAKIPGQGELTFVAACRNVVAGFDPGKKRLVAYAVEELQPRSR